MAADIARFSVIIPNFNNAATLARAIESVLLQTYPAKEIIVVDDGSTDESKKILQRFGDAIISVWQPNQGVSAARNNGVSCATGNWIAFLDADDEFLPNRLAVHAEWINEDPDIDFLLSDQESRTPDGKFIELYMSGSEAGKKLISQSEDKLRIEIGQGDFEGLIADGFTEVRTISLPRTTFLRLGGFDTNHRIGEDLHFFVRLFSKCNRGGVVPAVTAIYYIHPASAIRKDPLKAMLLFVATLESLRSDAKNWPKPIQAGYLKKMDHARRSLAYAYLRKHHKMHALSAVLPNFTDAPSLRTLRQLLSVMRGFSKDGKSQPVPSSPDRMPAR